MGRSRPNGIPTGKDLLVMPISPGMQVFESVGSVTLGDPSSKTPLERFAQDDNFFMDLAFSHSLQWTGLATFFHIEIF